MSARKAHHYRGESRFRARSKSKACSQTRSLSLRAIQVHLHEINVMCQDRPSLFFGYFNTHKRDCEIEQVHYIVVLITSVKATMARHKYSISSS